ncbi:MAG: phosphatase PAP2 family protein [Candidatus Cloacimonetes bacterium]|nr:phosphatase PAP2 family protein [Candidatus Cloacimonadota bacterium]
MKKFKLLFLLIFIPLLLNSYVFEVNKTESFLVISAFLALDLSNNYFDRQIISKPTELELSNLNQNDVPFFDKIAFQPYSNKLKDLSDYTAYLTIGTAIYCLYDNDTSTLLDNLIVYAEIMTAQSAIGKWTKTLTKRFRPFVYDPDVDIIKKQQRNSQHSFYSHHSSTVFAAATCSYYRYYQKYGHNYFLASLLFSTASATAILRVASAQHFPSDVVIGALMGSCISFGISKYHNNNKLTIGADFNSIKLEYRF